MATELREFLVGLAADPKRLAEFMADPDAVMEEAELAEDDRNLLKSGNLARIQARLAHAAARWQQSPAGALPGAALWQQALSGAVVWQQALPGAMMWQQAPPGALPGAVAYLVAWPVNPFRFWWL